MTTDQLKAAAVEMAKLGEADVSVVGSRIDVRGDISWKKFYSHAVAIARAFPEFKVKKPEAFQPYTFAPKRYVADVVAR